MSRNREDKKRRAPKPAKPGAIAVTFLCCILGVPTAARLLPGIVCADAMAALQAGVLLGLAYLLLRPLVKLVSMPLGCLTLGLSNFLIDVGLLYGCAYLIAGFEVLGLADAVCASFMINAISAVAGGFR